MGWVHVHHDDDTYDIMVNTLFLGRAFFVVILLILPVAHVLYNEEVLRREDSSPPFLSILGY